MHAIYLNCWFCALIFGVLIFYYECLIVYYINFLYIFVWNFDWLVVAGSLLAGDEYLVGVESANPFNWMKSIVMPCRLALTTVTVKLS